MGLGALVIGVLAIGGVSRWVVIVLTALAAGAAASQVGSRRRLAGVSPLLIFIGVAVVLTAFQVVPLPGSVVGTFQPTGLELVVDGELVDDRAALASPDGSIGPEAETKLAALRNDRLDAWRPLSLDPATTRVELAELCVYFMLAWMALRAAASERGRQRLLACTAGIAGVVAVVGIVHEVLGAERLFAIYDPVHAHPIVMAPLLNANHLACLMALGALVAGGLALHERRAPAVRAMWIVVAMLCVGVGLATQSRGGVIGLAAGATVMAVIIVLQRLREAPETKRADVVRVAVPAAIVVLCTLVLVIYFGGAEVRSQLEATRIEELDDPRSKYAAWASAFELVDESPVFGVGRGGFESAFTRVHPASGHVTFSHVENEYLQALVDWGVVGALALAAALGFGVLVVVRRWRSGLLAAAAIGGLTAVAVHSLVDFGLELPGVAIPTLIVAATVLYVPLKESSRQKRRTMLRAGAVAFTGLVGALAAAPFTRTLMEDHQVMRGKKTPSIAEARAAFERHPIDYSAAAHVAYASTDARERIAYLNHALRLSPNHPGLHRAVARWLAQAGKRSQAAIEYRLALMGTDDPEMLVIEITTVFPLAADAASALPVNYPAWNRIATQLVEAKRADVALAYLVRITEAPGRHPVPEVWRRMSTIAQNARDFVLVERALAALLRIDPSLPGALALAKIQLGQKAYDRASTTLAPIIAEPVTTNEHVEARVMSCEIRIVGATTNEEWEAARTCLADTLTAPTMSLEIRRKIHGHLAKVEDALGNKDRAELERRLAAPGKLAPEPPSGLRGLGGSR